MSEHTWTPLPWQIAPFRDKSQVMLLTGSAGGGKSLLAATKVDAFLRKYPGAMALMMRKQRQSMMNSTVLMFDREVLGSDPFVKHYPTKYRFEYGNGSILAYGGMDDDDQKEAVRSIGQKGGLDLVWFEEANKFAEEDYDEITARMRGKAAPWTQIILSTNPDYPMHWIRQRLILGGEASVYYSSASDNSYNPEEYIGILEKIKGVTGKRLREGQWVQAEGVVYEEYTDTKHVIDPFEIPPDWRRVGGIDFGFRNPFVALWCAADPDDNLFFYREIYHTNRIVQKHAEDINRWSEGEEIESWVCDHDAEDRATLEAAGIYTIPAEKSISSGIDLVKERLENGTMKFFRTMLVERDGNLRTKPSSTLNEFPAYSWETGVDGKPNKDRPAKLHDHGMDTVRYIVNYFDSMRLGMEHG